MKADIDRIPFAVGRSHRVNAQSPSLAIISNREIALLRKIKKSQKKITNRHWWPKPKKTAVKALKRPKPIVVPNFQKSQLSILKRLQSVLLNHPTCYLKKGIRCSVFKFYHRFNGCSGTHLSQFLDVLLSEGILFFIWVCSCLKGLVYIKGSLFWWIAFGVIAYGAGACFFKWFFYSDWRSTALEGYGLNFGFLNSITPDASFEAWLRISLAFLFYHIGHWKINDLGRSRFFSYIIGLVFLLGFINLVLGHEPLSFFIPAENLFAPIQRMGLIWVCFYWSLLWSLGHYFWFLFKSA